MATHFSIPAWRISWTEEPVGYTSIGCKELDTTEATWHMCTHHVFLGLPWWLSGKEPACQCK